jgi:nucleotide-binding universal stress UspA family protein
MSEAIVVGTDGSETAHRAVAQATRLAKALGADLHVVAACRPMRGSLRPAPTPEAAALLVEALPQSEARAIVDRAAGDARAKGVGAHTHVHPEDPCAALMDVAARVGATTIVVGNRGMSGARRLLGSVPDQISHRARCNVLIVSTGKAPGA